MNARINSRASDSYTLLRASLALFKKQPEHLEAAELEQAKTQAANEFTIETRILKTPEAGSVIISEHELQTAYQEIRDRYIDEETFLSDLNKNNLDIKSLRAALFRQCRINAILEMIASRSLKISEVEVGIYYHLHKEQFHRPELREASHIYISVNPDYPENTYENALCRSQELYTKLLKKPHKFADLALKHSECPSALQGGVLGTVPKGKLYPEIDDVLFKLKEGKVSQPVKSEIGFHLVLCQKIQRAETLSLQKATPNTADDERACPPKMSKSMVIQFTQIKKDLI